WRARVLRKRLAAHAASPAARILAGLVPVRAGHRGIGRAGGAGLVAGHARPGALGAPLAGWVADRNRRLARLERAGCARSRWLGPGLGFHARIGIPRVDPLAGEGAREPRERQEPAAGRWERV